MNSKILKKTFIYAVIIFLVLVLLNLLLNLISQKFLSKKTVYINKIKINAELAKTTKEKIKGLSDRDNLCDNCGMLFIYGISQNYTFWMKDMKFALDFIWIQDSWIVELTQNVPAPSNNTDVQVLTPEKPVNIVLEVPAGFIEKNSIKVGDIVRIE